MKTLFIIYACFFTKISLAQQHVLNAKDSLYINDATNSTTLILNFNSKEFIRILDGFELKENNVIPKSIKINSVRRLNDTLKLKKLGIENFEKPYMLLSSFALNTRRFIYTKANIDYQLQEINLTVILNNELITFAKYSLLDNLDTSLIKTVKYVRPDPMFFKYNIEMPLGIIQVTAYKKGNE